MNGPAKKEKIGLGLSPLQIVIFLSGFVVVIGLLMEDGPEIVHSIEAGTWPTRQLTGDGLVTIGVFFEVALAIFVERSARRAELQADRTIADTLERATKAEERLANMQIELAGARQRQLEAERMIVELSRAQAPRANVFNALRFAGYLEPLAKGKVEVLVNRDSDEPFQLAWLIEKALVQAGWTVEALSIPPSTTGLPALIALGANAQGLTVMAHSRPLSLGDPYKILCDAFIFVGFPIAGKTDERTPDGLVRIVVGPKP